MVRPAGVPLYRTDDLLSHLDGVLLQVDIIHGGGIAAPVDARRTLTWDAISSSTHDLVIAPAVDDHLRWELYDPDSHRVIGHLLGDPTIDRLRAGRSHRDAYRRKWRLGSRELVVALSGPGERGLAQFRRHILHDLIADLPVDEYQIMLALHPDVWREQGAHRVHELYGPYLQAGLWVMPTEHGWQSALVAADHVIGDSDQLTTYAQMMGRHTMTVVTDGGPAGARAGIGVLAPHQPLRNQLVVDTLRQDAHTLERYEDDTRSGWRARYIGSPAQWSGKPVVEGIYERLGVEVPTLSLCPPVCGPAYFEGRWAVGSAPMKVRTDGDDVEVWVRRLPATFDPLIGAELITVDLRTPNPHWSGSANIVACRSRPDQDPWVEIEFQLAELTRSRAHVESVAVAYPFREECLVGYTDGRRYRISPVEDTHARYVDPQVYASVLVRALRYVDIRGQEFADGIIMARLGPHQSVPVHVRAVDLRDGGPASTHQAPYTRFGHHVRVRRQEQGWSLSEFTRHIEKNRGSGHPLKGYPFRHTPIADVEAGRIRPDARLLQDVLVVGLGETEPIQRLVDEFCTGPSALASNPRR